MPWLCFSFSYSPRVWDLNYVFFSLWLFPLGLLLVKSGLGKFPRFLGWWLMITCIALLFNFFTRFLSPGFYRTEIFWITGIMEIQVAIYITIELAKGIKN